MLDLLSRTCPHLCPGVQAAAKALEYDGACEHLHGTSLHDLHKPVVVLGASGFDAAVLKELPPVASGIRRNDDTRLGIEGALMPFATSTARSAHPYVGFGGVEHPDNCKEAALPSRARSGLGVLA
ncbi:hypothetical protein VOLCADRAFT_94785 [Volvox carteri f. nagariensis]|uniref:Uncharacterized protein n=1 Tax=Volvox carteri f. nagariensis TaxID=3068 RepID=D8U5R5_VOLCA|nr:uncharacterized protein VOLCADRAFT_94785 [Volvox carteri f. nagariensis]EFJ44967.1 hypothetical protein VOLCADRAFT_94785 [Volvox carteri f. nagariensis]|eukprot:XP_002953938.1 hypothetical protein VOLCADRAFT_94785 [Volvox carteri f. nagariensis]